MTEQKEPHFDLNTLKIGDQLWDSTYGWGKIDTFDTTGFPIFMIFNGGHNGWYSVNGFTYTAVHQSLFYDEIKITPPPRPKKIVKRRKIIENIKWYKWDNGPYYPHISSQSIIVPFKDFTLLPPMTMTLEWEEEE